MKSIFIFWNYPQSNIIFLWKLIDQINATFPSCSIECHLLSSSKEYCDFLNLANVKFSKIESENYNNLQLFGFDVALLFHPQKELVSYFKKNKIETVVISNQNKSNLDILDNFKDPLEKILDAVVFKIKCNKVKREKLLNSLRYINQKSIQLNQKTTHHLTILIDVSDLNVKEKTVNLVYEFTKLLLKDSRNYIILIGDTNHFQFEKIECENCLNKINKISFFQNINLIKKVDLLIAVKGPVTDYFCIKNKAILEIASRKTPSLIRNSMSNYYSKLINLKTNLANYKINKLCLQLAVELDSLMKRYNLNIKNNQHNYFEECFVVDNPTLFIFSSHNQLESYKSHSLFLLTHFLIVKKWSLAEYMKVIKEIDISSIKVVCGNIPIILEAIIRVIQWLKKPSSKIIIVNLNLIKQISISDYISTVAYNLKKN